MRNKEYVWPTAPALVLLLSACGNADGIESRVGGSQTKSINKILAPGQQVAGNQEAANASSETIDVIAASRVVEESSEAPVDLRSADDTDLNLTKLNVAMVFSEVYNIMINPNSCVGRTIRMRRLVAIYHDETKDTDYYFCIAQDTTTCCVQSTKFELADSYRFPNDYPPGGSGITVRRRFDVYKESEYKYAVLKDAMLEKISTENGGETTAP